MANMLLGWDDESNQVVLAPKHLLRHVVVLGASGSGKTVACKAMVEEAVRQGISVIAIDPQGDLASLGMRGDKDAPECRNLPPSIFTEYFDRADVKIWTPGSSHGIPVSVSPIADIPDSHRKEERIRTCAIIASSLASLIEDDSPEVAAAFSLILESVDERGLMIENLKDFADWLCLEPPQIPEDVEQVLPLKQRERLARKFRALAVGPSRLMFELGRPICVKTLLGHETGGPVSQGKSRISVIYLNSLTSQEEKEFFVAALANSVYSYMLRNPTPGRPQGIFYLDEAAPYLPPVRKPASKESLMLLLRQARKYGIVMQIATQSPGDLDYKGLAQVGTWLLGRMSTGQEAAKVGPILRSMPGVDANEIIDSLPGLSRGRFILASPDAYQGPVEFNVRYLVSKHTTLTEAEIETFVSDKDRKKYG